MKLSNDALDSGQDGALPVSTQDLKPRQDSAKPVTATVPPAGPIVLRLEPFLELTSDLLLKLSSQNDSLRLERNAEGELEILPPTSTDTGNQNFNINVDFGIWARGNGTGVPFDSSTGFTLPNGAVRSPDVSWILRSRLAELTEEQRTGFWRICPDFVIEIRSGSDTLGSLQRKMEEYIANGTRLGWLIDSVDQRKRVYVYRPGAEVEVLEAPESISGDPELPGFTLDLKPIWEPGF